MSEKVYKDSYGFPINLSVKCDITDGLNFKMKVKKPDGTEVEWTASGVQLDPGIIQYITEMNDLTGGGDVLS